MDTLSGRAAAGSSAVRFEGELLPAAGPQAIGRIVMVSAGASWIASLIGKFMIEELPRRAAEVDSRPSSAIANRRSTRAR